MWTMFATMFRSITRFFTVLDTSLSAVEQLAIAAEEEATAFAVESRKRRELAAKTGKKAAAKAK